MTHTRSLVCITEGDNPLTLDEVKSHLRVESSDSDEDIESLMSAALQDVDGESGLGIALLEQQWRMNLQGGFYDPCPPKSRYPGEIVIPLPPLQEIDSVKYIDTNGALQTLDTSTYRVIDRGQDPSSITPVYGTCWPSTRFDPESVQITFTAGYADADSVPAKIKSAMKLMIGHLFSHREAVTDGRVNQPFEMPMGVDALLSRYRRNWF